MKITIKILTSTLFLASLLLSGCGKTGEKEATNSFQKQTIRTTLMPEELQNDEDINLLLTSEHFCHHAISYSEYTDDGLYLLTQYCDDGSTNIQTRYNYLTAEELEMLQKKQH